MLPKELATRLQNISTENQRRYLVEPFGIDFCSNDYLGFTQDEILRKRIAEAISNLPNGASGSRLLRGHHDFMGKVERELATRVGQESALIFPSGYQANVGLLSTIASANDLVFSDQLNHASIIDGIKLSGAKKIIYPHCDLNGLASQLKRHHNHPGLKLIVTESLFSMDGDFAPLKELAKLAEQWGAQLIVDEAHATALFGDRGGGLIQELGLSHNVLATLHTGGKALGVGGAWVAANEELIQFLVNFSRPFIFSTAPSPFLFIALREAWRRWDEVGQSRADRVLSVSAKISVGMKRNTRPSQIIPLILGSNQRALAVAAQLKQRGFDLRAIRYPTVALGAARLRMTLPFQSLDYCDQLEATLTELLKATP